MIENKENRIKFFGLIILIILAVFLVVKFINRPYMKIMVEYTDVPAISDHLSFFKIDVHYRGFDVGDVTKVQLAKDQEHIDFYVNITYKGLKIPTNSLFIFKTENIYGSRYLDIQAPQKPSGKLVTDGDVINGFEVYERIDQYFIDEFKSGQTGTLIKNLSDVVAILKTSLEDKENKKLLTQSSGDLAIILENFKDITEDPTFKKDIKSVIKHSSGSLNSLDEILRKKEMRKTIDEAPKSIKKTLDNISLMNEHMEAVSHMMPEATKNIAIASGLITEANGNLCSINSKVPPIPPSLVENAEKLVIKTDCFESELSKLLSKSHVMLRLIFGNPGKSFNDCAKNQCLGSKLNCAKTTAKK